MNRAIVVTTLAACFAASVSVVGSGLSRIQQRPTVRPKPDTTYMQGSPSVRADQNLILSVPATAPWTDTGLTIRDGDRLTIRAWGTVSYGEATAPVTPNGLGRGGGCSFVVTNAAVPAHALVANIAPQLTFDGQGFLIGSQWSGTAPIPGATAPEGHLFLGFNHSAVLCDRSGYDSWAFRVKNSGTFTVEIAVWRKR